MPKSDPMLRPRVLLGAGWQARHVLDLMRWMDIETSDVLLFDDRDPGANAGPCGARLHGDLRTGLERCIREQLPSMVALGSRCAALRYALFERLEAARVPIASLIHPAAWVAPTAEVGKNVVIMPGCVIGSRVTVGPVVCMFGGATVEHDARIGANATLGPGVTLSGFARVGEHAFVGAGATLAPEASVGARSVIGAGAVVVSEIGAGKVAVGIPAKARRLVAEGDDAPTAAALRRFRKHGERRQPAARASGS